MEFFSTAVTSLSTVVTAIGAGVGVWGIIFTTAVSSLSTVVTAIGAGVGVWGVINLMEGYGGDNPASNAHVP